MGRGAATIVEHQRRGEAEKRRNCFVSLQRPMLRESRGSDTLGRGARACLLTTYHIFPRSLLITHHHRITNSTHHHRITNSVQVREYIRKKVPTFNSLGVDAESTRQFATTEAIQTRLKACDLTPSCGCWLNNDNNNDNNTPSRRTLIYTLSLYTNPIMPLISLSFYPPR